MGKWGFKFLLSALLICSQAAFSQSVTKVLVSGLGGTHDLYVKDAFYSGYASYANDIFEGEVILYSQSISYSFAYAQQNGYQLMIRSTTGLVTGITLAPQYPDVKLVMPAGSNSFVQVYTGDVITSPVVVTGAGVDSNVTGYKLEFFSIDPITGTNASSYSNGFIAGQLAFIANTLNISLDSARMLARPFASENGEYDFYNGFGRINVSSLLESMLPVELSSFTATAGKKDVKLKWRTETETNNYGFEVQRKITSSPQSEGDFSDWESIGFVNGNNNSNSPKEYSFIDNNLIGGKTFLYRLKQIDNDGRFEYSKTIEVSIAVNDFVLHQNYPNPFSAKGNSPSGGNSVTTIRYELPVKSFVTLKVYNAIGEEVAVLVNDFKNEGKYSETFSVDPVMASGVYYCKIEADDNGKIFSKTIKMIVMK